MARLIAREAVSGLPIDIGRVHLSAVLRTSETLIMPFNGREAAVSMALGDLGLSYPAANSTVTSDTAAIIWAGRSKALLINAAVPQAVATDAAIIDQTGAQAVVLLSGVGIEDVLARFVPIDLRSAAFPQGAAAQTMLGHMMAQVRRTGTGFEISVMRSMALTLVHELTTAAEHIAARAKLP